VLTRGGIRHRSQPRKRTARVLIGSPPRLRSAVRSRRLVSAHRGEEGLSHQITVPPRGCRSLPSPFAPHVGAAVCHRPSTPTWVPQSAVAHRPPRGCRSLPSPSPPPWVPQSAVALRPHVGAAVCRRPSTPTWVPQSAVALRPPRGCRSLPSPFDPHVGAAVCRRPSTPTGCRSLPSPPRVGPAVCHRPYAWVPQSAIAPTRGSRSPPSSPHVGASNAQLLGSMSSHRLNRLAAGRICSQNPNVAARR